MKTTLSTDIFGSGITGSLYVVNANVAALVLNEPPGTLTNCEFLELS